MIKRLLGIGEWLSLVMFVVVVLGAITYGVYSVWPRPAPEYAPLRLLELSIDEQEVMQGGWVTVRNGFCNDSDEQVIVEVYLAAQRESSDPVLQAEVVPIIEREAGTGSGRGLAVPLDHGCISELPVQLPVARDLTPGRWRLFLELVVRGSNQEELQRTTGVSNYITVLER